MIYQWKAPAQLAHLDAQACGEVLATLDQQGALTPRDVVNAALPPESPLHPAFEWDDARAAHQYREVQARHLIRSMVIVREDAPPIRAFVSISGAEEGKTIKVYTSLAVALADPVKRQEILVRARAELMAWRARYQALEEFAAVFTVIDETVEGVVDTPALA